MIRRRRRRAPFYSIEPLEPRQLLAVDFDFGLVQGLASHNDQFSGQGSNFLYSFQTALTGRSGNQIHLTQTDNTSADLDMELWDSNLNTIATAQTASSDETISLANRPAGTYYIFVTDFAAEGANFTNFNVAINAPSNLDDIYEPNNDFSHPADLGNFQGSYQIPHLVAADDDWYSLTTVAAGSVNDSIAIDFDSSAGDLDLYLYDSGGNLIRKSDGVTNHEEISLAGLPADGYSILVHGYLGASNPNYTLSIATPKVIDDLYEPNDLSTSATDFGELTDEHTYPHLASLNDDWYTFTTLSTSTSAQFVSIDFLDAAGDLDLYLYDTNGPDPIAKSISVGNHEQISLAGLPAGQYYIGVFGYQGATNPDYSLTINAPFATLAPDSHEPNDTLGAATDLRTVTGEFTVPDLTIDNPADEDWFAFTTAADSTSADSVRIDFSAPAGDLDLELYDADGNFLGRSNGTGPSEQISLAGLPAGTYYAHVYGYQDSINQYTLTLETPQPAAIPPDNLEPNNTTTSASDLRTLPATINFPDLTIHNADDVDFFQFQLAAGASSAYNASINFPDATGDLDLYLFNAAGTLIGKSDGTADSETIPFTGLVPNTTYYLEVAGYDGATNHYSLTINAPVSTTVAPDAYETQEPINLTQSQTLTHLTIHQPAANGNQGTRADTFSFHLSQTGSANDLVQIRFSAAQGQLKLILKSGATTLATASTSGDIETVSLAGRAPGDYTITVDTTDANGSNPDYSLTINAPFEQLNVPDWTVLVYMDGDNNLEDAAIGDVNEMESAPYNPNFQYVVELDRAPGYDTTNGNWTDTRRGGITPDANPNVISSTLASVGEKNMADPATLADFLAWGTLHYPAHHFALVLWDHGAGPFGAEYDDTSNPNAGMTLNGLHTALANAEAASGEHISVIGFDACLMATAETVTAAADSTDYLVASEETEGGDGWDYNAIPAALTFPADPRSFASSIVQANRNNDATPTLSATQTSGNTLTAALAAFVTAALNGTNADFTAMSAARDASPHYEYEFMHDLSGFMTRVKSSVSSVAIQSAAQAVLDALIAALVNNYSTLDEAGTGLTVYLPNADQGLIASYASTAFTQQTNWLGLVNALLNHDTGAPRGVQPDYAESNNTRASATDLQDLAGHGFTFSSLSITPGDHDYFRFTTLAAGTASDKVTLSFDTTVGDLSLFLYNASGTQIASSAGSTNTETVSLASLPASQYFIRVAGASASVSNPAYTLTIDAPQSAGGDFAENNDTVNKAYELATSRPTGGLTLTPGDIDWYTFATDRLPASNPLIVDATFDPSLGSLTMTLFDNNNVQVASSTTGRIQFPGFTGENYFLKVTGAATATDLPYTLNPHHDFTTSLAAPDTTPPASTLKPIAAITRSGGTALRFTVTYSDNIGLNLASIGSGDIKVTNGTKYAYTPKIFSRTAGPNNTLIAVYTFVPPGKKWDPTDAGTYKITLLKGQILDTNHNANPARVLGTFKAFAKRARRAAVPAEADIVISAAPAPATSPFNSVKRILDELGSVLD